MPFICVKTEFSTELSTETTLDKAKQEKPRQEPKIGQFCQVCQRRTCLKTKKLCFRLERYLKQNVEKKFWHGVESYLDRRTFVLMQKSLYGVEIKRDITKDEDFIHI